MYKEESYKTVCFILSDKLKSVLESLLPTFFIKFNIGITVTNLFLCVFVLGDGSLNRKYNFSKYFC